MTASGAPRDVTAAIFGWFSSRTGTSVSAFGPLEKGALEMLLLLLLFSWRLAWPMAERQIEHRKSRLVISTRFLVVNWRSRPVAKSAYCVPNQPWTLFL